MENSAYVPNPLPPPSLVVFSQAGGLPNALRMQRPFTSQAQEGKELGVSLGGGGGRFGLRLMESYPGLPSHLLHLPQFLHPGVPFPGSFPSAFAPPPPLKSLKMEEVIQSSSPASASVSPPPLKEEDIQELSRENSTPGSESTECSTPDEGRGFRRKKKTADSSCCPVCGVTVRPADLDSHFIQELERLYKLSSSGRSRRFNRELPSSADGSLESRWETYQRIKVNRQSRLRLKNRKRKPDEVICPVCNDGVNGTIEQLNNHVELCLRKEGKMKKKMWMWKVREKSMREYEWAGQRRIRASSLLLGGYEGVDMSSEQRSNEGEEEGDGDVVVDGDDSATFGPSQYTEADIIVLSAEGNPSQERERRALRDAVISSDGLRHIVKEEPTCLENKDGEIGEQNSDNSEKVNPNEQVIDALKCKIRQLEADQNVSGDHKFICLICMGAKKLCPQCNMITSPSDLRKIYL